MNEKPKSEEERKREAKKARVEVERSLAKAIEKFAQNLAEILIKDRKIQLFRSLRTRLDNHLETLKSLHEGRYSPKNYRVPLSHEDKEIAMDQIKKYESIRKSYSKLMGINKKDLDDRLPKIPLYLTKRLAVRHTLRWISKEERQVKAYLRWILPSPHGRTVYHLLKLAAESGKD